MTNAWTPGPWVAEQHSQERTLIVAHGDVGDGSHDTYVAQIFNNIAGQSGPNARLAAAAPDMAEALMGAMVCIDMVPWPGDEGSGVRAAFGKRRDAILAALARARGEA